jgi:hypothetical protein
VTPAMLKSRIEEWGAMLIPPGCDVESRCLFTHDFAMVVETLSPTPAAESPETAELTAQ